jgi:hypothetical protein
MKKKTRKRIRKILIGIFIFIVLLFSTVILVTFFYGNGILKNYVVQAVENGSKGMYHASIRRLNINLLTGNVNITGFRMVPDTALYNRMKEGDTIPPLLVGVEVEKLKVRGMDFQKLILEKAISIDRIIIESPEVRIILEPVNRLPKAKKSPSKMFSVPLPKGLSSIEVKHLTLTKGRLKLTDQAKEPADNYIVPRIDIEVKGFRVNSRSGKDKRILNADDITLILYKLELKTRNSMYSISAGQIGISTSHNEAWLKDLKIKPLYSRHEFSRKLGYQTDRIVANIDRINLSDLNIRQIAVTRKLDISKISIDGMNLEDYRDKRVPMRSNFYPLLPQQALLKSKTLFQIDTVQVTNGKVTYLEQTGKEPGTIFFEKIEGTILNVTNSPELIAQKIAMIAEATLYVMGKGKLQARLVFPLGAENDAFTFSGLLTGMDLKEINPMLTKLVPAEITGGRVQKLEILPVSANNYRAKGTLKFYYTGLEFNISSEKTDGWSNFKGKVLNFVASAYVVSDNPSSSGNFTPGIIYFERNRTKGIFNFLWKSTFSGLKSTMNINTKKQKEIKKENKKKK